jgi:hypothetical protein
MIQYGPIEHSFVEGTELYFVYCIFVHGYKQGRGDFQKKGMGKALLRAAEEDARALGALGIAAWSISLPFWMKASWFKKHGYREADRQNGRVLVWKPFTADAQPPRWFPKVDKRPEPTPGKVNVTALSSGWYLAQNLVYERARRAAAELGEAVEFREIDTSSRSAVAEWGVSDAVFVDVLVRREAVSRARRHDSSCFVQEFVYEVSLTLWRATKGKSILRTEQAL